MTKRRTFDDYDYTEAYSVDLEKQIKEQNEKLQEDAMERLLRTGKVECLYRTTTIKSTNTKSGTTLLESQVYPSFYHKGDMPKTKQKRESSKAQKALNDKNARRYLTRLANINFGSGDIWATFGWDDGHKPSDIEAAQKDVRNFIHRINYRRKKAGLENAKYIYVLAVDEHVRPHFHLLISGDGIGRDELESMWGKCKRPNTRRVEPDSDKLITGLATYISQNPHGTKRWCASKNLEKPDVPTRSYTKFTKRKVNNMARNYADIQEAMEKAYPGYKFIDAEIKYNGVNAAFYIYARMVRN